MFDVDSFTSLVESSKLSENCKNGFAEYLSSLTKFELWAVESKSLKELKTLFKSERNLNFH